MSEVSVFDWFEVVGIATVRTQEVFEKVRAVPNFVVSVGAPGPDGLGVVDLAEE